MLCSLRMKKTNQRMNKILCLCKASESGVSQCVENDIGIKKPVILFSLEDMEIVGSEWRLSALKMFSQCTYNKICRNLLEVTSNMFPSSFTFSVLDRCIKNT